MSSCSISEFALNKRLYNKGFYVDFNKTKKNIVDTISSSNKDFKISNVTKKINKENLVCVNDGFSDDLMIEKQESSKDILIKPFEKDNYVLNQKQNKDSIIISENNEIYKKAKRQSILSLIFAFLSSSFLFTELINSTLFFGISFILAPFLIVTSILLAYNSIKNYRKTESNKYKWLAILGLIVAAITGIIWVLGALIIIIMFLFSGLY